VVAMFPVNARGLRPALIAVLLGGFLAGAYGIYMYHSGAGVFGDRLWIRTDDSSWNPDQFAMALLLPLAISIYIILNERGIFTRLCACGAFGTMVIALFLSGARGALLAFIAMLVYIVWFDRRRGQLLAMSLPVAVVGVIAAGPSFMQRWQTAGQSGGSGRTEIWKVGWMAFKHNWLFGAGYANFPLAYNRAFIDVFQPIFVHWGRASHNILIGGAVELGIIGLVLLLLAWWGQFRLLRDIPRTDSLYPLRVVLEASIIGLFICGLFADIMIEKYPWLAFMVVALVRTAWTRRASSGAMNERG
jgi:exopolysaccharide production protein ExoQ